LGLNSVSTGFEQHLKTVNYIISVLSDVPHDHEKNCGLGLDYRTWQSQAFLCGYARLVMISICFYKAVLRSYQEELALQKQDREVSFACFTALKVTID